MHSATDFLKIGAQALKHLVTMQRFTHIFLIDEGDIYLKKIAEVLCQENDIKVSLLVL